MDAFEGVSRKRSRFYSTAENADEKKNTGKEDLVVVDDSDEKI